MKKTHTTLSKVHLCSFKGLNLMVYCFSRLMETLDTDMDNDIAVPCIASPKFCCSPSIKLTLSIADRLGESVFSLDEPFWI